MEIRKTDFGKLDNGDTVDLFTMDNGSMQVQITNYGCIITSLKVPDKNGELGEVVLGFDTLEEYLNGHPYFGAIVGPIANRISNAKFKINNTEYIVDANEGLNQLHGGKVGFDKVLWHMNEVIENDDILQIEMTYLRPDGLMGYPGNLNVNFRITLFPNNRLDLNYEVTTDRPTIVNLTHHDYFNLKDGGLTQITDHILKLNAPHYTPTQSDNCVTGEILPVEDTPFDFTTPIKIDEAIRKLHGEIKGKGFDHNFVLSGNSPIGAILYCESTGRQLEVYTNKPCLQFYTAEHLDGSLKRGEVVFKALNALCLETQFHPDAINQVNFPNIILQPDGNYDYFTSYIFTIV